jgi:hypothetical protein
MLYPLYDYGSSPEKTAIFESTVAALCGNHGLCVQNQYAVIIALQFFCSKDCIGDVGLDGLPGWRKKSNAFEVKSSRGRGDCSHWAAKTRTALAIVSHQALRREAAGRTATIRRPLIRRKPFI